MVFARVATNKQNICMSSRVSMTTNAPSSFPCGVRDSCIHSDRLNQVKSMFWWHKLIARVCMWTSRIIIKSTLRAKEAIHNYYKGRDFVTWDSVTRVLFRDFIETRCGQTCLLGRYGKKNKQSSNQHGFRGIFFTQSGCLSIRTVEAYHLLQSWIRDSMNASKWVEGL